MKVKSEQEMLELGRNFDVSQRVIELIGDVGVGKTTFVRGLAEGLGVKEAISSPSFTISKTYALPGGGNYDFYLLAEPGLMKEDLEENINNPENIVVVEWADSVAEMLPDEHRKVYINYVDENTREIKVV